MRYFNCDYNEGMAAEILAKLNETNMEQTVGYGEDCYCESAIAKIRAACQKEVDVHFMVGGTQTNLTFISANLRPHQGIISADCGHINTHETGAIENSGHKIIALPTLFGKITAKQVSEVYEAHASDDNRIHSVQPKMVYISNPTEWGTTYSKTELSDIYEICKRYNLIFYIDGARLAYALADSSNEMDLPFMADNCDAFYIGGTKCGTMFGEALVITDATLNEDFRYLIKQKGAMLAKGRLLGLQFATLFTDNLYESLGAHGAAMAELIREACRQKEYPFYIENNTNQVFPIMPVSKLKVLQDKYCFMRMEEVSGKGEVVRFCTSWATKLEDVQLLVNDIISD
jgi:Threonine aldolase